MSHEEHPHTDYKEEQFMDDLTVDWSDHKPTKLFTALLHAQAEMPTIKANDYNPHFKSSYAQYQDIVDAVREPLNRYGLLFFHQPHLVVRSATHYQENENGYITREHATHVLYTYIVHAESGQWMRGMLSLMPAQNTEQARGSSISYVKRYSLVAMLGVATRDDDDGNAASQRK